MADRPLLARATAAVGAAVLAGCIGAAVVHAPARRTARRAATTTTAPPFPTTSMTVPTGDPDVTGEVQAPQPGLYRYRETTSVSDQPPTEWAEELTPVAGGIRVKTTRGVDETVRFEPFDEVELAYAQAGDTVADEVACTEQPPRRLLQLPLQPGAHWQTDTTCTNLLGSRLVDHRVINVTGPRTVPLGPADIKVWELVVVSRQTEQPSGFTRTITTTLDISARRGVVVRQVIQQGSDP